MVSRWLFDLPIAFVQDMGPMRYITMGWVSWVMPFALTGLYMQFRTVGRGASPSYSPDLRKLSAVHT